MHLSLASNRYDIVNKTDSLSTNSSNLIFVSEKRSDNCYFHLDNFQMVINDWRHEHVKRTCATSISKPTLILPREHFPFLIRKTQVIRDEKTCLLILKHVFLFLSFPYKSLYLDIWPVPAVQPSLWTKGHKSLHF